jgi:hypothetical protein
MVEPKYYNTAGHPRISSTTSAPKNNLSPAAQAVRKAYYSTDDDLAGPALAAALRAAAKQMSCYQSRKFLYSIADAMKLLAIADELEALPE